MRDTNWEFKLFFKLPLRKQLWLKDLAELYFCTFVSNARVRPRTSKGITDLLLLLNLVLLDWPPNYWQQQEWETLLKKMLRPTAPSVPRRSPIQVLTRLNVAYLQWSDENWGIQHDMAVGKGTGKCQHFQQHTYLLTYMRFCTQVRLKLMLAWT